MKSSVRLTCPPECARVSGLRHAVRSRHCHRPQPRLSYHRWSPLFAVVSKPTRVLENRCAPATKCARRSRASTTNPLRGCSHGSVLTCPSSCTTRASRTTFLRASVIPLRWPAGSFLVAGHHVSSSGHHHDRSLQRGLDTPSQPILAEYTRVQTRPLQPCLHPLHSRSAKSACPARRGPLRT